VYIHWPPISNLEYYGRGIKGLGDKQRHIMFGCLKFIVFFRAKLVLHNSPGQKKQVHMAGRKIRYGGHNNFLFPIKRYNKKTDGVRRQKRVNTFISDLGEGGCNAFHDLANNFH
jgi:hypothetical protein